MGGLISVPMLMFWLRNVLLLLLLPCFTLVRGSVAGVTASGLVGVVIRLVLLGVFAVSYQIWIRRVSCCSLSLTTTDS